MLVAHRGFRTKKGENRMIDFNKSLNFTKGVEFDIRLTKDKKIIIFHDDNFKRIGGVKSQVSELKYSEIKEIPLFKNNIENLPPLFIDDFCFNLASRFKLINVELKYDNYTAQDYEIFHDALEKLRSLTEAEIIVSSFNRNDLQFISKLDKNKFEKGYLFDSKESVDFDLIKQFNYLHPSIKFLKNKNNLQFINQINLDMNVWTFKNKSEAQVLYKKYGEKIANYISDIPDLNLDLDI